MDNRWEDLEALFVACATEDLLTRGEVEPVLAAFAGPRLRFLAWLRPFEKGAYADPLIELCALAVLLDADRLALCMSGRVWSLNDPIAPVTEDVDLRERALVAFFVDGARGRPIAWSVIQPYDVEGDAVRWDDPRRLHDGSGWIPATLKLAVRKRGRPGRDGGDVRRQARRVDALGHGLYVPEDVQAYLRGDQCEPPSAALR